MTIEQVENEALKLKPEARAELAQKLLKSLEGLSDEEIEQLWVKEAVRRDGELDSVMTRVLYLKGSDLEEVSTGTR